jgi:hypothetical protein
MRPDCIDENHFLHQFRRLADGCSWKQCVMLVWFACFLFLFLSHGVFMQDTMIEVDDICEPCPLLLSQIAKCGVYYCCRSSLNEVRVAYEQCPGL